MPAVVVLPRYFQYRSSVLLLAKGSSFINEIIIGTKWLLNFGSQFCRFGEAMPKAMLLRHPHSSLCIAALSLSSLLAVGAGSSPASSTSLILKLSLIIP